MGKVDPGGTADGPFDYGVGGLVAAGVGIATSAPAPTTKFDPKVEPRIPEGRDESGDQKLVQGPERSPEIEAAKEGIVESVTSQIPASGTEYLESVGGPFNPFAQVNAAKGLVKAAETALSGSSVERSRLGGFILGSLALGAVAGKLFGGGPGAASGEAPPKLGPETGPAKAATTAGPRGRAALDPALKAEIDSALTEANKGTTTLHHGGVLRGGKVQGGRTFSTTPDLEHAQKFAEMHGGGVTSFEVPNDWLRNQLSPSVRGATEMTDFLESTGRPAPEIRFTSKVAPQLNAFRVKDR